MIEKYLWPDDPWACAEPEEVQRIYGEKYRIAQLLHPASVLEIGVRAGYTAAMFLASGCMKYVGLDATDSWGGTPGAVSWARSMLPSNFASASVEIHHVNTQSIKTLSSYGNFDLVHVDGDHSLIGCLHDLVLSLSCNPTWILVDDITHHPESCRIAAECFGARYNLRHIFLPNLRGDMLFQVRS